MTNTPALDELEALIESRESVIRSLLVARAVDEMLAVSLEAADEVEGRLIRAGYERAARGDWFIF
jgi:hypothetical protein